MKALFFKTISVALLCVSPATVFAQSVARPGQIAPAEAIFSSPIGSRSSSYPGPQTRLPLLERKSDQKVNRIWMTSMLAMLTATGLDAQSSWGKREGNSLLASSDGTFGGKGLSIKAGVAAGLILPQLLLHRHNDLKSKFAIGNFAEAALFGGVAIHNWGIPGHK